MWKLSAQLVIGLAVGLAGTDMAGAQTCGAGLAGSQVVEGARYTVAFRAAPAPIAIGRHFAVELVVCAKSPADAPTAVRLDAFMPEHNHGMNYKPALAAAGPGRYRSDGWMFHMPGR